MEKPKDKINLQPTIIDRIKFLMKKNNIRQTELCDKIGVKQANLSKILSDNGVNKVTVDMLFNIANYFGVSTDFLLGRTPLYSAPLSSSEICCGLINYINNNDMRFYEAEVDEEVLTYGNNEKKRKAYPAHNRRETESNKYKMFYFSNYKSIPDDEYDRVELIAEGNVNYQGREINDFIDFYLELSAVHKKNHISDDLFNTAVQDRLNQLKF